MQFYFAFAHTYLVRRGSSPGALDDSGKTPLQIVVEKGANSDEELFSMLTEPRR